MELDHYLDLPERNQGAERHRRAMSDLGEEARTDWDTVLAHNPEADRSLIHILYLCWRYTREAVLCGIHPARVERIGDAQRVEAVVRDAWPETAANAVPLGLTVAKLELGVTTVFCPPRVRG